MRKIGQPSEPTDWSRKCSRSRVDGFADLATLDQQWIHTGRRACEGGSARCTPIAHGQLTMSIMSFLPGGEGVGLRLLLRRGASMGIFHGWNKVRLSVAGTGRRKDPLPRQTGQR